MSAGRALLSIRGLAVALADGRRLLQDIDLDLHPGHALGLVGSSGSGKSMLARALIGMLPAGCRMQSGEIRHGGRLLAGADDLVALRGRELAYMFQDSAASLHPLRRIGAQLQECWRVHRAAAGLAASAVADTLVAVGLEPTPAILQAYPHQLSGGQRQRAMLALTLLPRPRLLIADEVASALDPLLASRIYRLLRESVQRLGLGLLFIGHDLARIAEVCDEVAVIEDGRIQEQGPAREVYTHPRSAAGKRLAAASRLQAAPDSPTVPGEAGEQPIVVLAGLDVAWPASSPWPWRRPAPVLRGIDLAIARGQRVGVVGASGSGKSSLAQALLGLLAIRGGGLEWFGRPWQALSKGERRRLRARAQMVFQDPFRSLDPLQRVDAMLAEALALAPGGARSSPAELLAATGLDRDALQRYPSQFSGGQRQRLAIARALALDPQLLICDEATSALDSATQAQIVSLLARLSSERGLALLFIAHDLPAIAALCPELIVLDQGRLVEHGATRVCLRQPRSPALQALVEALPAGVLALDPAACWA